MNAVVHCKNWLALILISAFSFKSAGEPLPAQPNAPRIGVIHIEKITAKWMEKLREAVEKKIEQYHHIFRAHEKKLRAENAKLMELQEALQGVSKEKKAAWVERKNKFEAKVHDVQKDAEIKRKKLGAAHDKVVRRLNALLSESVKDVATQYDIHLVYPAASVIYWRDSFDITDKVAAHLADKIKSAPLKLDLKDD